MPTEDILEVLLIITLPTAVVLLGLLTKNRLPDIWWNKLLIILGIALLILLFIGRL